MNDESPLNQWLKQATSSCYFENQISLRSVFERLVSGEFYKDPDWAVDYAIPQIERAIAALEALFTIANQQDDLRESEKLQWVALSVLAQLGLGTVGLGLEGKN